ncbi:uncharacterized protein LOC120043485 [Salvelinus namaycush]|uniref:Uncharacterized protein LOC120043485 n=1 Tax=Salvelinus namaycush TaxID=8040 RepID=A0A8U0QIL9_SALNM|nr:uncharacterized protein LOC120043485 [Salvelinus namaycush]
MGSLKQIKTEFLHCESGKKEAVEFLSQIKEIVLKHRNSKIPLAKPKSYELRIGGLEDTVHAGDGEQLEVWKDCYLPERMEMVVIGALDDFRCSAAGWQLVLLLCEDGNVYAYEFEVLHLVARSLEDLFKSGAEFPGLEKFRFGECFEELTEEEMEKEMQCDEIKKIDDEHIQFRRRLEIEMLEDLKAIKQSETIVTELPTTKGPSSGSPSVAEMACEFRTLAAESGWNDEALQGAFRNALTETLKDELVSREEPEGLDKLISLTIDNRLPQPG